MAKFGNAPTAAAKGYINTVTVKPDTQTHEGGQGWTRDPESELFLLAVTNMCGEHTFYEKAGDRDQRFEDLIAQVAKTNPNWLARLVPFLRGTMNMRSASIVLAAETVAVLLAEGKNGAIHFPFGEKAPSNRNIIASAIQRADEPAEMLGYWRSRHGRALPQPVKRGIADAAVRLYNERSFLKYGSGDGYRMADVIDITHPDPKADWQSKLFKFILDDRHDHATEDHGGDDYEPLAMIAANRKAMALSSEDFRKTLAGDPEFAEKAGLTWEVASSRYGKLDADFWKAMVPNMGIFATVRNLRNMDDAEVDSETAVEVLVKLEDPEIIGKSRMFPLRFYQAYKETAGLRWSRALETALDLSVANVPSLKGKTLILVDVSGSMKDLMSDRSKAQRWETAAIFGSALALRAEQASLFDYGTDSRPIAVRKGGSVLRLLDEIKAHVGGGTWAMEVLADTYNRTKPDRVIILTDEQAFYGVIPGIDCPIFTFNLAGYKAAHLPSTGKHWTFGGLTDAGFTAIELLEKGSDQGFPF